MGHDSINLSYGIHLDRTDNSINEMITYDIDDSKELKLKMANILGSQNALTPKEIVREVWKNNILHSIR